MIPRMLGHLRWFSLLVTGLIFRLKFRVLIVWNTILITRHCRYSG